MKKLSLTLTSLMYLMSLGMLLSTAALEAFSQCKQCCVCASPCKTSTFCNTDGITIPQADENDPVQGDPSPSCIKVCGLSKWSVVKGLTVKLENVLYQQSNLVNVVLLSPCGDAVVLLNAVGEVNAQFGNGTTGVTFCFSDCDGLNLDCNQDTNFEGTIKARPTDCDPSNNCITGVSNSSFGTQLSATFCKPACGCWKLFTCVKAGGEGITIPAGSIGSWKLIIDHCIPCEKPCVSCNNCNSCDGCPQTSNSCTSCTSSCNSCNSSCNSWSSSCSSCK